MYARRYVRIYVNGLPFLEIAASTVTGCLTVPEANISEQKGRDCGILKGGVLTVDHSHPLPPSKKNPPPPHSEYFPGSVLALHCLGCLLLRGGGGLGRGKP